MATRPPGRVHTAAFTHRDVFVINIRKLDVVNDMPTIFNTSRDISTTSLLIFQPRGGIYFRNGHGACCGFCARKIGRCR